MKKNTMRIIKGIIWFFVFLLLILVLPLQIFTSSPYPAILPYLFIPFMLLLNINNKERDVGFSDSRQQQKIKIYVSLFVVFVLIHFIGQLIFNAASLFDLLSSLFIYLVPTFFFFYFIRNDNLKALRYILWAIVVAGIIVGGYFVYDSYLKLIVGEISDYSLRASEYEQIRKNTDDINNARLKAFERAYGLLETHSVSAAWVSFGCFASLALISFKKSFQRSMIILISLVILLCGLNFTSILSFLVTIGITELGFGRYFSGYISKKGLKETFILATVLTVIISAVFTQLSNENMELVANLFEYSTKLLSGDIITREDNDSFVFAFFRSIMNYPSLMMSYFPPGLLIGDGFSIGFGLKKGGDYGIIETLYRFGIVFFIYTILVLVHIIKYLFRAINSYESSNNPHKNYLKFALSILIYISISEFHYSIWNSKSILVLIFLVIAITYKSMKRDFN
jgi:hypothetical protein